jgi:hypothetical protein
MNQLNLAAAFLFLACIQSSFAQSPDVSWNTVVGGSDPDEGYSARITADAGYIVTGVTMSFGSGGADVYMLKIDQGGDTLWTSTFGGASDDWGECVNQTADGGYVIAGGTDSFGAGNYDVYLVRTDASGDTLWTRSIGGTEDDVAYAVEQTADGGCVIAGSTESFGAGDSDVYLIRMDSGGNAVWTKTMGGMETDAGGFVQQTSDGGFIVIGSTESYGAGASDVYLIRTDSDGEIQWTRTFGGTADDEGYYVQQTADGGFILTGYSKSFGAGQKDVYLVRTDADGDVVWTKTLGGSSVDVGESVLQTADGGYVITGFTSSYGAGGMDVYLLRTDSAGDTLWTKTMGGTGYDRCNSVQISADGGYFAAGLTTSFGSGSSDVYLIKLDPETGIETETGGTSRLNIAAADPNPFSSELSITYTIPEQTDVRLAVFDLSGRMVDVITDDVLPAGSHAAIWTPSQDTPAGCYLLVLNACGRHETRRCLRFD